MDLDAPPIDGEADEVEAADQAAGRVDPQSRLVGAEPHRRIRVDAPPGTGKTWAACARVAALIEQGVPPSRIWMISFTRTAVAEIRSRVGSFTTPAAAASVRISTLDAYAWALQSGFDADATLSGSHDEGIAATLERVESDPELQAFLARIRHLVIDEAQDIMGVRARLTAAVIGRLDPEAGVTVFADEAQAIYGFTEEASDLGGGVSLLHLLPSSFERIEFAEVRRTRCPKLRELFLRTRRRVIGGGDVSARAAAVRRDILALAHDQAEPGLDGGLAEATEDRLILFRRRAEVLRAASYAQDRPYRLRMSGLPTSIHAWIAELFWNWPDRRIGPDDCRRLSQRLNVGEVEQARRWSLLVELAGDPDGSLDLHRLRQRLARSAPPQIVATPDFGSEGPLLGTVHASKGREADHVSLWLPPLSSGDAPEADAEEIRVAFVGATRARLTLRAGEAGPAYASSENGRVWRRTSSGFQIEIGRAGDIRPEGLVGAEAVASAEAAAAAQKRVARSATLPLRARACADLDWRFALETQDGERLAVLSDAVTKDVKAVVNRMNVWPPPSQLSWLRSLGTRTVAVAPDDPLIDRLHEPWRTSGFMLAPLLTGFAAARTSGRRK
ncbi:MAG: UvrD-helicase domain-containing protein [Brevundimonas sp.]